MGICLEWRHAHTYITVSERTEIQVEVLGAHPVLLAELHHPLVDSMGVGPLSFTRHPESSTNGWAGAKALTLSASRREASRGTRAQSYA